MCGGQGHLDRAFERVTARELAGVPTSLVTGKTFEGAVVVPCVFCGIYGRHERHEPYEVHPQAGELLETVGWLLRHGQSPAQVLAKLLECYGEEPEGGAHRAITDFEVTP